MAETRGVIRVKRTLKHSRLERKRDERTNGSCNHPNVRFFFSSLSLTIFREGVNSSASMREGRTRAPWRWRRRSGEESGRRVTTIIIWFSECEWVRAVAVSSSSLCCPHLHSASADLLHSSTRSNTLRVWLTDCGPLIVFPRSDRSAIVSNWTTIQSRSVRRKLIWLTNCRHNHHRGHQEDRITLDLKAASWKPHPHPGADHLFVDVGHRHRHSWYPVQKN